MTKDNWKNKLFYGDNLEILRKYIENNSIDLCYIDPPFNSKRNYNQIYLNKGNEDKAQAQAFIDTWVWSERAESEYEQIMINEKSLCSYQLIELIEGLKKVLGKSSLMAYLVSMALRILEIQRILKPTGSFYLHCDATASHYLKLVCDSIFCAKGGDYINEIIWRRTNNPKGSQFKAKKFGVYTDNIFFYSKTDNYFFELDNAKIQLDDKELQKKYPKKDSIGNYYEAPILRSISMGERPNLVYEYKGFTPTSAGWRMTKENLIELDNKGNLGWSNNNRPFRKLRPQDDRGNPISNLWDDIDRLYQSDEKLEYPTQKPEALLERIVNASCPKNGIILDAYCGCGTTIAVAQKLKRRWIGIDITFQSISLVLERIENSFTDKVLDSIELNGVPKDFESAEALAHKEDDRTRKEFEKWAVLTYSKNRAIINEKKGKDYGIEGIAFISDRNKDADIEQKRILFSVKSDNKPKPAYVRELIGTMEREKAVFGFLITLYPPTSDMILEANKAGKYKNELFDLDFKKVHIITANDIINGERLVIPKNIETKVIKKALMVKDIGVQTTMEI